MKNYIFSILLFLVIVIFSGGMDCDGTQQVVNPPGETGTGGLILGTTDGGLTWDVNIKSDITSIISVSCLSFDPNDFCFIGRTSPTTSRIYRTTDFGRTFTAALPNNNIGIEEPLDLTNTSIEGKGYVVGTQRVNGNPLFITTDGGSNWESGQNIITALWCIDFNSNRKGITLPEEPINNIYLTTDEGTTWTPSSPITSDYYLNAVKFTGSFSSNEAVACGNNGKIFRTDNAGANWSEITSPVTDQNFNDVDFIDPVGIIVGDEGTILRTADGGHFWQVVTSGVTNRLNKVYLDASAYYIAGEGVLLKSTNQGQTWTAIRTAPNQNYLDMFFIKNTGVVVGSTHQ